MQIKTHCPMCGDNHDEMIVTEVIRKYYCHACSEITFDSYTNECEHCSSKMIYEVELKNEDRAPASTPCSSCIEASRDVEETVKNGGKFWQCLQCSTIGAFPAGHPVSNQIQGLGLEIKSCPFCKKRT